MELRGKPCAFLWKWDKPAGRERTRAKLESYIMPVMPSSSQETLLVVLHEGSSEARKDELGSFSEELGKIARVHPPPRKSQGIPSSFGLVFSHGEFQAIADSRETWRTQFLSPFPRLLPPLIPKHKYMEEEVDFSFTDKQDTRQREACGMHSPMDLVSQKDWPGHSRRLINSGSSRLENVHFMHQSACPWVKRGPCKLQGQRFICRHIQKAWLGLCLGPVGGTLERFSQLLQPEQGLASAR